MRQMCINVTKARDWYIDMLELTTALLYGSLQGLCNVAGILKANALTANCQAMDTGYCYDACTYCQVQRHMSHRLWVHGIYVQMII